MATKWGCVGPGKISSDFFLAVKSCLPAQDHEFVSVASKDLAKAQKFAEEFKFKRAYDSYDELAQDKDVGTLVPLAALGDVRLVQASICFSAFKWHLERMLNASLGGGGVLEAGIYLINLACMVFKEMPESITAVGQLSEAGDIDVGGCIILKYKNGAMANLSYHMDTDNGNFSANIMGTKGSIQIPRPFHAPNTITTPAGTQEFKYKSGEYTFANSAGLAYEAASMRKTILSGELEDEVCTLADSEMIMTILDEVRRQIGMNYPDFD